MDEQAFWYIIASSLEDGGGYDEQLISLKRILQGMTDDDLIAFQEMVDHMMAQAYRWGLWGAAYIMQGGISDEGFEAFRAGLIMKGKDIYEAAVVEPDSLADIDDVEECEDFLYLACEVYEERNSDGAIYDRFREEGRAAPEGDSFDENDSRYMREQYPRLWEIYCADEA
ncbi:MAG: DUF4240 domain-containing protein [Cyanobacteria bacterium SZAS TMP-1]|nr:DUF4240 domain-containing protein [Cyanobacteria bacterium SZAS TMP-1]